jgi:catechol 2,3-dioxygenase-like lactoylglutathione lyase family enzyme
MLHHVTLAVAPERVRACARFYALLGFLERPVPEGIAGRAVWLESRTTQIHLMHGGAEPGPWGGHLAVVLDDYDGTLERLRAAGHEADPRSAHWGSPRAYLTDPAGHTVEVMAFPPEPAT